MEYKLRCAIVGHSMDVRAVAAISDSQITTASRDQTAKLWSQDTLNSRIYKEKTTYKGHTGYISSICFIPGTDSEPDGFIATGSRDSTILIFPCSSTEATYILTGHTDTVSCLSWSEGTLISGSWDHSVKVWKNWKCILDLKGHSGPVWSVAVASASDLNDTSIISASADKTLKCWSEGKEIMIYAGHSDCVRGVAIWGVDQFLSCSNDASVRLWKLSGECLATYYGHTNFIYSIVSLPNWQGFVTSGEDRTVRTWDCNGNLVQTIYLPAQSVWTLAVLPNSDIVTGSSDGVCTVFTQSSDRTADDEELKQFESSLSKFKVASEEIGGIKKSEIPDKSILLAPGKKDGQTVMVRDEEKVLCYNWSASKQQWEAVGEVVGGSGGSASSSGKILHQGKEYDYVFDVDLDEGRTLKLPYNKGEDPYMVAQAFIHQNDLPQDYLDQVANFIITNANVTSQSITQAEGCFDPFTGGSRYVPSTSSSSNGRISNVTDPFTGSGRYIPSAETHSNATVMETDPFTGSGRYVPNSSYIPPGENKASPFFPQLVPLKFESVNRIGILNKFKECNDLVSEKLTDEQMEAIVEAVTSSNPHVSVLSPLEKALQWPSDKVWPVLDVLRLAVRSEAIQDAWLADQKGTTLAELLVGLLNDASSSAATKLLSLRCLANMASHPPGRKVLKNCAKTVIGAAAILSPYENKNFEIAAATLTINYSIILRDTKNLEDQCQVLSYAATIALTANDSEAIFRSLVAIGTLLSIGGQIKSLAKSLDLNGVLEKHATTADPQKVGECAKHILRIL